MIPTTFLGWRRLRQKRGDDRIPERFEEYCEDEAEPLPVGSFTRIERRVDLIFTRYPRLQKPYGFLRELDAVGTMETLTGHHRLRFQTDSIHEPLFRSLVVRDDFDEAWFQRNDEYLQGLSVREKMALVAMTNKSQQHVQGYILNGRLTREFMDRIRSWKSRIYGYLPIFFPLLDRYGDPSISVSKNYRRIVRTVCPGLTDEIITDCVRDLHKEVVEIFRRAPKTTRDLVLYRGLKHQPRSQWTRQGFAATTLDPFHALHYAEQCLQQIRVLPGTPLLFLGGLSSFRTELECLLPDTVQFYRTTQSFRTIPLSPIVRDRCPLTQNTRRLLIQTVVAIV